MRRPRRVPIRLAAYPKISPRAARATKHEAMALDEAMEVLDQHGHAVAARLIEGLHARFNPRRRRRFYSLRGRQERE